MAFTRLSMLQMPFHQRGVSGSDKGRQPFDQLSALFRSNEAGGLHRINQQLDLRCFKVTGRHMVEVLNPAVFDNIHTELHKLFDVVAERARVGGDVVLLQKRRNIRKGDWMGFVRGLPEVFEYDECSICERHVSSLSATHAFFLRGSCKLTSREFI